MTWLLNCVFLALLMVVIIGMVIAWVNGVDYMSRNYPEYKGEDFLKIN